MIAQLLLLREFWWFHSGSMYLNQSNKTSSKNSSKSQFPLKYVEELHWFQWGLDEDLIGNAVILTAIHNEKGYREALSGRT